MLYHRSRFRRASACVLILLSCLSLNLNAHPLGNDSITRFSVLYVLPDRLEVDYLLDIAETQSIILRRDEIDADKDETDTAEEQQAWLDRKAVEFEPYLKASIDGHTLNLKAVDIAYDPKTGKKASASRLIMKLPGNLGLPTYRLMIRYVAPYPEALKSGTHELAYNDETYPDMPGLSRIILERTTSLTPLPEEHLASLEAGELSSDLRDFVETRRYPFGEHPVLITLDPGRRWQVRAGERDYAIIAESDALRLYRLPRIEFIPPRPIFWDEGVDPFIYEQYDPADLPDERHASIRFKIIDAAVSLDPSETAANDLPAATTPEGVTATSQPSATGNGNPEADIDPIAQGTDDAPSVDQHDMRESTSGLPPYMESFTSPANDPSKTQKSYRQGSRIIAMLRGEGEFQGRSGFMIMLLVTGLAFAWGAGHALMPGHAKTVVAAYLISQKGTYWHAILLAIIVTITHTALVVIVGLIIWFYQESHPEIGPRLQNWLGVIAGLMVAGMGAFLSFRAFTGRLAHHHDHDHHHHDDDRPWWKKLFTHSHPHVSGHDHDHDHDHKHLPHSHSHDHTHSHDHHHVHAHDHHAHGHVHDHEHDHGDVHTHVHEYAGGHTHHSTRPAETQLTTRTILVLGISGGIVPCPTATIIILLGLAANVMLGALYAVGVFSLGLAITLMLVGFFALSSRRFASKVLEDARHEGELSGQGHWLLFQAIPTVSGLAVVCLGLAIAANYYYFMRTGQPLISWLG